MADQPGNSFQRRMEGADINLILVKTPFLFDNKCAPKSDVYCDASGKIHLKLYCFADMSEQCLNSV